MMVLLLTLRFSTLLYLSSNNALVTGEIKVRSGNSSNDINSNATLSYSATGNSAESNYSLAQCKKFMIDKGCTWTQETPCPDMREFKDNHSQKVGQSEKPDAEDDGSIDYYCCCTKKFSQESRIMSVEAAHAAETQLYGLRWERHIWETDADTSNKPRNRPESSLPLTTLSSFAGGQRQCYERRDIAYNDGNFRAREHFWREKCELIENDPEVESVMVSVGNNLAFYRPYGENSWCDMLTSSVLHEVSRDNKEWSLPDYFNSEEMKLFGGSQFITDSKRSWENAAYLPFWGSEQNVGACCDGPLEHPDDPASWGKEMLMSTCRRCETLAYNSGDFRMHGQFWQETICGADTVPPNASFIRVTMGSVVDYFKPAQASEGICPMLKSSKKHLWSPDGVHWRIPDYFDGGQTTVYGGSAEGWPKKNIPGDNRDFLSFWGATYHDGGCCGSTLESTTRCTASDLRGCFHQALRVEYCV
jgi:hypothetical protein